MQQELQQTTSIAVNLKAIVSVQKEQKTELEKR